jgi:HK97 gp10 family phage protein
MARPALTAQGFREASRQLNNMSKAAAQGVGKRSLAVPAEILAAEMRLRAPRLSGALGESIVVKPERARRGRPQIAVVAEDIASVQNEFGNSNMAAQPFARPAKDAKESEMFDRFGEALKREVDAAVIRKAKREAKRAARG